MAQDGAGVNVIRQATPLTARVTMVYTETVVQVPRLVRTTMVYTETVVKP